MYCGFGCLACAALFVCFGLLLIVCFYLMFVVADCLFLCCVLLFFCFMLCYICFVCYILLLDLVALTLWVLVFGLLFADWFNSVGFNFLVLLLCLSFVFDFCIYL